MTGDLTEFYASLDRKMHEIKANIDNMKKMSHDIGYDIGERGFSIDWKIVLEITFVVIIF